MQGRQRCCHIVTGVQCGPIDWPARFAAELSEEGTLRSTIAFTERVDRVSRGWCDAARHEHVTHTAENG